MKTLKDFTKAFYFKMDFSGIINFTIHLKIKIFGWQAAGYQQRLSAPLWGRRTDTGDPNTRGSDQH